MKIVSTPQAIEFSTSDGLMLPGLFYEAKNTDKAIINLHGNGSSSVFYNQAYKQELADIFVNNNISFLNFNNRGAHFIKSFTIRKNDTEERKRFGMSYEKIKDCIFDIDAAILFLEKKGYKEFYLIGHSTGANKICVYDYYKPDTIISKYILVGGGDDTGIYYDILGENKFWMLLEKSKEKIKKGKGDDIIKSLLPDNIFSYNSFYDIANPDGDYNCFPFLEVIRKIKLSKKPLFRYYKAIQKSTLVVYGENDEYAWGEVPRVVEILKKQKPEFTYKIIPGADHGLSEHKIELGEIVTKWLK